MKSSRKRLGCPGDSCTRLKQNENACEGCSRFFAADESAEGYLPYIAFLLKLHHWKEKGYPQKMKGNEVSHLIAVLDELDAVEAEIRERERELKENERTKV